MRKFAVLIAVIALTGCGANTAAPTVTTGTSAITETTETPSSVPAKEVPSTTAVSSTFSEAQLTQLESSVNNAQTILDQTDQLSNGN